MNLPHHLSESTFRFYEPYLTLGIRNFPTETSWDVGTLRAQNLDIKVGPVTFAARFRDAYVSLLRFNWAPTTVDLVKLQEIRGKFSISLQAGTSIVWFKNKGNKGRPTHLMAEARTQVAQAPASVVPWKDTTFEEIESACRLLNKGRINGPIITDLQLSDESTLELTSTYDVAIIWDDVKKQTLIT